MKKLFFIAALGVAGMMSANGIFELNRSEANILPPPEGEIICSAATYMYCSGNLIHDTLCWDENNPASFIEMQQCHLAANTAWSEYNCP